MFKNFLWSKISCQDQPYEIKYFDQLIGYLDSIILPKRKWEEPKNLTSEDKLECKNNKRTCELDILHCGPKYKQFVLGRLYATKCFIPCPNYEVLNISDWTMLKNDLFIKYVTKQNRQHLDINLPPCKIFPIRIYVNKSDIPPHDLVVVKNEQGKKNNNNQIKNLESISKFATAIAPGAITSRELCLLIHIKFNFYAIQNNKGLYEDFVVLSLLSLKKIQNHYKQLNKKLPKLRKLN